MNHVACGVLRINRKHYGCHDSVDSGTIYIHDLIACSQASFFYLALKRLMVIIAGANGDAVRFFAVMNE